jgi:CheY-like chemotaxis protein
LFDAIDPDWINHIWKTSNKQVHGAHALKLSPLRHMLNKDGPLLIVEDQPLLGFLMVEALEGAGYDVCLCTTGADALTLLDTEAHFAGLLTDVRLGAGPDGWEVARRAREKFPDLPLVYVTGDSAVDFDREAEPHSRLFQKPFAIDAVIAAFKPPTGPIAFDAR